MIIFRKLEHVFKLTFVFMMVFAMTIGPVMANDPGENDVPVAVSTIGEEKNPTEDTDGSTEEATGDDSEDGTESSQGTGEEANGVDLEDGTDSIQNNSEETIGDDLEDGADPDEGYVPSEVSGGALTSTAARAVEPEVRIRFIGGSVVPGQGLEFEITVVNSLSDTIVLSRVFVSDVVDTGPKNPGACTVENWGSNSDGGGLPSIGLEPTVALQPGESYTSIAGSLYMVWASGNECQGKSFSVRVGVDYESIVSTPVGTVNVTITKNYPELDVGLPEGSAWTITNRDTAAVVENGTTSGQFPIDFSVPNLSYGNYTFAL